MSVRKPALRTRAAVIFRLTGLSSTTRARLTGMGGAVLNARTYATALKSSNGAARAPCDFFDIRRLLKDKPFQSLARKRRLKGGCSQDWLSPRQVHTRSEERRVGKECRSRWAADP